jgi:hypothetical protein
VSWTANLHIGFLIPEKLDYAAIEVGPELPTLPFVGSYECWEELCSHIRKTANLPNFQYVTLVDDVAFLSVASVNPFKQASFTIGSYHQELARAKIALCSFGFPSDISPSIGIYWYRG